MKYITHSVRDIQHYFVNIYLKIKNIAKKSVTSFGILFFLCACILSLLILTLFPIFCVGLSTYSLTPDQMSRTGLFFHSLVVSLVLVFLIQTFAEIIFLTTLFSIYAISLELKDKYDIRSEEPPLNSIGFINRIKEFIARIHEPLSV